MSRVTPVMPSTSASGEGSPEHVEVLVEDLFIEDFAIPLALPKTASPSSGGSGAKMAPGPQEPDGSRRRLKLGLAAIGGGIAIAAAAVLIAKNR